MKITNVSNKIIGIGNITLMPDESHEFSKEVCELPAIVSLVKNEMLAIEDTSAKEKEEAAFKAEIEREIREKIAAEAAEKEAVAEEKKARKSSKKAKNESENKTE